MLTIRSHSLMRQIFTESFILCLPCITPCVRLKVKYGKQILPFSAVTELLTYWRKKKTFVKQSKLYLLEVVQVWKTAFFRKTWGSLENQIRLPKEVVVDLRSEGSTEVNQVKLCVDVAVNVWMCMHRGPLVGERWCS